MLELLSLPNEILLSILYNLRSLDLFPLGAISHRFHDLVLRIITHRLTIAASLQGHQLLLECFHPSARLTQPSYICSYLDTPGLDDPQCCDNDIYPMPANPAERMRKIQNLYSRYRPVIEVDGYRSPWRPRRADVPGSRTWDNPAGSAIGDPVPDEDKKKPPPLISQLVHLDAAELFSQLCTRTILDLAGSSPPVYHTLIDVSDGVIRIWRDWMAMRSTTSEYTKALGDPVESIDTSTLRISEDQRLTSVTEEKPKVEGDILWVNDGQNVGVKFRVKQRKWRRDIPILISTDEDMPVTYEVQYEELLVRTSHLLLKWEDALVHKQDVARNAVIFRSF